MSDTTVIQNKVVISNANQKCWVPEQVVYDGIVFVRISKWDRGFIMFCTGRGLTFGDHGRNINVEFLDTLQRLRTQAADDAVKEAFSVEDDGHRKKRLKKARKEDKDVVPFLYIDGPDVRRSSDVVIRGIRMQVLFGIKNSDIWVRCDTDNLEYIRHGVLSQLDEGGRRGRHRAPKGLHEAKDDDDKADDNKDESNDDDDATDEAKDDDDKNE